MELQLMWWNGNTHLSFASLSVWEPGFTKYDTSAICTPNSIFPFFNVLY